MKSKNTIYDEVEQIKAIAVRAFNFEVDLSKHENKYECTPSDSVNVFNFWYTSQDIKKDTAIAACYHLLEQYECFTKFSDSELTKLKEKYNYCQQLLPQFSFLPLNSKYLNTFEKVYKKMEMAKHIQDFKNEYLFGDIYFITQLLKLGYAKIDAEGLVFALPYDTNLKIEISETKIKIGISEPQILRKDDLIYLKWFAKLAEEDRNFFNIKSFEEIKFHIKDQMSILAQLQKISDLNSWIIDRYNRSKRTTELFFKKPLV